LNEVRIRGLKHQKEKRSMDHSAGLDVSVKETSICIVDDTGRIVREVKVASEGDPKRKNPGEAGVRLCHCGLRDNQPEHESHYREQRKSRP
jgi:hypothetical protein